MVSRRYIKIKLLLKRNWPIIFVIFLWFFISFLIIAINYSADFAIAHTFWVSGPIEGDGFSTFYYNMSDFVVVGAIVAFLLTEFRRRYDPLEACKAMAKEMKKHAVILGYPHFGERVVEYLQSKKKPYVLVEPKRELVEDLVKQGEPVIVDDPEEWDALKAANVPKARVVIIALDDVEIVMVAVKRIRDLNPKCRIITRCFYDELEEVLEAFGNVEVISTSRWALENIKGELKSI